jgi:uncharacterized protein
MIDARAVLRVVGELLWSLRREGIAVSTAQALDVVRAVKALGFDDPARLRQGIRCVIVVHERDRALFDAAYDRYWSLAAAGARGALSERLADEGFSALEIDGLRDALSPAGGPIADEATLLALLERRAEFDALVARAGVVRSLDAASGDQLGYLGHRLAASVGLPRARGALSELAQRLVASLGVRGEALAAALARELDRTEREVRAHVRRAYDASVGALGEARRRRRLDATRFVDLTEHEIAEARRAVRRFAQRLRGGARVRARRARHAPIDAHRTLRHALRTGGVPVAPVRRQARRHRPKLVLLCDVSDSVRAAAGFLLEFTYAAQELFERTRTFTFVSNLEEMTELFARERPAAAIERAWSGGAGRATDDSNYGRALRTFVTRYIAAVDRATTVVILGDGRTNYHDPAPELLDAIRRRARALVWLCPEPRGAWSRGDSAMRLYAPRCTATYEVCSVRDLQRAGRAIAVRT